MLLVECNISMKWLECIQICSFKCVCLQLIKMFLCLWLLAFISMLYGIYWENRRDKPIFHCLGHLYSTELTPFTKKAQKQLSSLSVTCDVVGVVKAVGVESAWLSLGCGRTLLWFARLADRVGSPFSSVICIAWLKKAENISVTLTLINIGQEKKWLLTEKKSDKILMSRHSFKGPAFPCHFFCKDTFSMHGN